MINSDLMYVYVLHTFTGLYFTQVAVYLANMIQLCIGL